MTLDSFNALTACGTPQSVLWKYTQIAAVDVFKFYYDDIYVGYIYIYIYIYTVMFVKLYFRTSDIYLTSRVSLDPSGFYLRTK